MSERDDRYARNDLPSTTAEFRAAPDASASTAQFKAFAAGQDARSDQRPSGSWPEQPWAGEAPGRARPGLAVGLVIGAVVLLVVAVAVFFAVG